MSLNRVCIIGNLGADPEVKIIPGGLRVTTLRIATNSKWADKDGKSQQSTEWHRVVVWGRLAEIAGHYLKKGRQVYVEGRIQTREWKDRSGEKRCSTEIVAQSMQLLGAKVKDEGATQEPEAVDGAMPPGVEAVLNKSWQ
jgi:single-strand DNA-binding protein